MRIYRLPAPELRSDAVVLTTVTPPVAGSFPSNNYFYLVGDNVEKFAQTQILESIRWCMNILRAQYDAEIPRPPANGGVFVFTTLVPESMGPKYHPIITDGTLPPAPTLPALPLGLTEEDTVAFGFTGVTIVAGGVNYAVRMGSVGMDAAYDEIKHYYLQKYPEASE